MTRASCEAVLTLPPEVDLHARPAAQFVRTAMGFEAHITLMASGKEADARSLLEVLGLGVRGGEKLFLTASGHDAPAAVDALRRCIAELH